MIEWIMVEAFSKVHKKQEQGEDQPVITVEEVNRKLGSEETRMKLVQKAALSKCYRRRNQHQIVIKEKAYLVEGGLFDYVYN